MINYVYHLNSGGPFTSSISNDSSTLNFAALSNDCPEEARLSIFFLRGFVTFLSCYHAISNFSSSYRISCLTSRILFLVWKKTDLYYKFCSEIHPFISSWIFPSVRDSNSDHNRFLLRKLCLID